MKNTLSLLAAASLITGCASMYNNDLYQPLSLRLSDNSPGTCSLENDLGKWEDVPMPKTITVRRSTQPLYYLCTTEDGRTLEGHLFSEPVRRPENAASVSGNTSDVRPEYPLDTVLFLPKKPRSQSQ